MKIALLLVSYPILLAGLTVELRLVSELGQYSIVVAALLLAFGTVIAYGNDQDCKAPAEKKPPLAVRFQSLSPKRLLTRLSPTRLGHP
ncbi:MAG: hypothetical protein WCO52_03805 [bacterium]